MIIAAVNDLQWCVNHQNRTISNYYNSLGCKHHWRKKPYPSSPQAETTASPIHLLKPLLRMATLRVGTKGLQDKHPLLSVSEWNKTNCKHTSKTLGAKHLLWCKTSKERWFTKMTSYIPADFDELLSQLILSPCSCPDPMLGSKICWVTEQVWSQGHSKRIHKVMQKQIPWWSHAAANAAQY